MAHEPLRDSAVDRYMAAVNRHPLLSREQEATLARRYRLHADLDAGHQLVVANLRFVVKVAHEYRGYDMDLLDLVQEGNLGLMMAVQRFDPAKECRLITYAVWWIRAYIHNYVMRCWSLVKVGTTHAQRQLFDKMRSAREAADRLAGPGEVAPLGTLAQHFGVAEREISNMELRLAGRDASLDSPIGNLSSQTQMERLRSSAPPLDERLSELEERHRVRRSVAEVMATLNEKERYVVNHRLMTQEPNTLREIGHHFRISRERVRQIEGIALRKISHVLGKNGALAEASA